MNRLLICKDPTKTLERAKTLIEQNGGKKSTVVDVIPEKNQLTVEQIRDVVERSSLTYPEGVYFVIHNFETAREVVQNTFLKTLEEHSPRVNFIIMSSSREAILPTILSRCDVEMIASTPSQLEPSVKKSIGEIFALYQETPSRPITSYLSLSPAKKKETITQFLNNFITYVYEEIPISKEKTVLAQLGKQALRAKVLIEENYFDPETALDMVFLK